MVSLTINNKKVSVPEDTTILEAAWRNGIKIPHCAIIPAHPLRRVPALRRFRKGHAQARCIMAPRPSPRAWRSRLRRRRIEGFRKLVLELILSDHPNDCMIL